MVQNIHVIISKNNSIAVTQLDFLVNIGTIDEYVTLGFGEHDFLVIFISQRDMVLKNSDALDYDLTVRPTSNSRSA